MTKENARKAAEVMLAYADGKEIECRYHKSSVWEETDSPAWDFSDYFYRIKPQPTYRPFKDAEECWNEMQKHQPFGWLKSKITGYQMITDLCDITDEKFLNLYISGEDISAEKTLEEYTFADGSVFGVKEE